MKTVTIDSDSLEATHAIGRRLGAALTTGSVIALIGPLGSGKTTLARGIADGAGVEDLRQVNSPTFVLFTEYSAKKGTVPFCLNGPTGAAHKTGLSPFSHPPLRIFHIDAYRLRGSGDLDALGFEEMPARGAVLIEWADRVLDLLPPDTLTLQIETTGENQRRFRLNAPGPISNNLAAAARI